MPDSAKDTLPAQVYFDLALERSKIVLDQFDLSPTQDDIHKALRQSPILETLIGEAQTRFTVAFHFLEGSYARDVYDDLRDDFLHSILGEQDASRFSMIETVLKDFQKERRAGLTETLL